MSYFNYLAMTDHHSEFIQQGYLRVNIIRSLRRKTLSLEIDHNGVKARAPQNMREKTIRKFIIAKEPWIRKHLSNLLPAAEPISIIDGIKLSVYGETYQLNIIHGRKPVQLINNPLNKTIILPITRSHLNIEQSAKRKLIIWYKKIALERFETVVKHYLTIILPSHKFPKLKARDYKRRWGSCDQQGNLSFNWRVVMAPKAVFDYVVIHELIHLIEFNHSPRFWRLVEQHCPDWKQQEQWLHQNGTLLYQL